MQQQTEETRYDITTVVDSVKSSSDALKDFAGQNAGAEETWNTLSESEEEIENIAKKLQKVMINPSGYIVS